jgi:hypothetical protein
LELSAILTTAQQTYFARFFNSNGINQTSFEETEIRGWGFAPLISSATLIVSGNQAGVFTNGIYYDLPSDFQLMLTESPTSNKLVCGSTTQFIKPQVEVISHDEYQKAIRNYYKKPYIGLNDGKIWRMYDSNSRVQLITPQGLGITAYSVKYLKQIPDIIVDRVTPTNQVNPSLSSEPKTIHETIVQIAMEIIATSNGKQVIPNQPGIENLS